MPHNYFKEFVFYKSCFKILIRLVIDILRIQLVFKSLSTALSRYLIELGREGRVVEVV